MKTSQIIISFLALVIFFSGCENFSSSIQIPTPGMTPEPYLTEYIPHQTVTFTLPIAEPTQWIPTMTPLSETSDSSPVEFIHDFVKTNGGCRLPCVLGIKPGDDKNQGVIRLIRLFTSYDLPRDKPNNVIGVESYRYKDFGYLWIQFWKEDHFLINEIDFYNFETSFVSRITLTASQGQRDNGKIIMAWQGSLITEILSNFALPSILSEYGEPSEILIRPLPTDVGHENAIYPFSLVLFYPNNGYVIEYVGLRRIIGDQFVMCPENSDIILSTWDPQNKLSLKDAVTYMGSTDTINDLNYMVFQPISQSTNYSIESFTKAFSQNPNSCIYTPISVWKNP